MRSYAFAPLTGLTVTDLLPSGLSAADYVSGSTLVTYPDLSQSNANPTSSIDGPSGRTRLTWALAPSTLGADQTLTIAFRVNIPAGAARTFSNETFATGIYAGRTFSAVGGMDVVRTNISLTKLATDDGAPEPGDVVTYTLLVRNNGGTAETTVRVTDAIPAGTTFVAGSITTGAPFAGSYSAQQNAVVWTAASFAAGGSATLTFQVRVNPDTDAGTVIPNRGIYESNETPTFFSNETQTTVVGPALGVTKSVMGGVPAAARTGETLTFEVQALNSGSGSATNVVITDPLATSNTTYLAGTMRYSLDGAAFVALTDASGDDAGTLSGTTLQLQLASLGPSADVRFRFDARVNGGTSGQWVNNQATASATQVRTEDSNLVQIPIANPSLVGLVFRDLNANGSLDPSEPGLPGVSVLLTYGSGSTLTVVTDASGLYMANLPAGAATVDVVEASLPGGWVRTTAPADPVAVTVAASGTTSAPNIGFDFSDLSITKVSDAGGIVTPGQVVTYTVAVTNNSGVTQTGIHLNDALPTGTSFVSGSARLSRPTATPFLINEYYIPTGTFTGVTYTLPLGHVLSTNYFVIVQGSDVDNNDRGPNDDYVSVDADGYGTGDFPDTPIPVTANQLRLRRNTSNANWGGVVTVVECLSDCSVNGFRLLDVQRVAHAGTSTSGTDNSAVPWTDIDRVVLFGGPNGAGCDANDADPLDHKDCHVRLFPSGTSTINWTRDNGATTSFAAATSTVMVVQWGSAWTVQHAQVTNGNNGNVALNNTAAYNTASISPVARLRTWVWGTGHTNDSGAGEATEGVVLTLGNGVAEGTVETTVAAGIAYANKDLEVDVYTLGHPGLAVDQVFQNDSTATALDVTVTSATAPRMALVYNSLQNTSNNYPRPMFWARYTAATTVHLERGRTTNTWAAWLQGIDFSRVYGSSSVTCANTLATCYEPSVSSDVVTAAQGYTLPVNATLTFTYKVRVDNPLAAGTNQIDNTARIYTTAYPAGFAATASDVVRRPAVDVDPNNAGYASTGQTITFTQVVKNTSSIADAYALTVTGERGWRVDLIDPDTGVVIASDTNSDGTWDAGSPPSTGTLAPGASKEYQVRVWVPAGTPATTEDTVRLRAASGISPTVWDDAKNEITVLPSGTFGSVIVTPDNSGVVQAGSYTAYAHRVINNTGLAETFDLRPPGVTTGTGVDSSQGWTNTIHWDTNGDGVYTPGTDLQILNTAQLPPGGSQLIFVVVNAPGGTASGTRDVSHITAWSRRDNTLFGAATDTSTVVTTPRNDLSGGGSRVVAPGDTAAFPGTVVNLGSTADRFELTVTASNLFGPGGDGLVHPTQLWVDTNTDGVPDTQIAIDSNGDGTWDVPPPPAWDSDGDGLPDVPVSAGGSFAYELRRPIALNQRVQRDFVTLTSRSVSSPSTDPDNVTATWIFAALTRAGIGGLRVDAGEVTFATSTQSGTASFVLYQTDDPTGATGREALHDQPVVSPVPDAITPILYTVLTRPVEKRFLMIEEKETDGDTVWTGPFVVGAPRLRRSLDAIERRLDESGVPQGAVRRARGVGLARAVRAARAERTGGRSAIAGRSLAPATSADPAARLRRAAHGLKVEVTRPGRVEIGTPALEAAGLIRPGPGALLYVSRLGIPVPHAWSPGPSGSWLLSFEARGLSTDYSDRAPYVLTDRAPAPVPAVPLTSSADPETPGYVRVERDALYVPSLPVGAATWQWDLVFSGVPWPDPGGDPAAGDFDLPELAAGAAGTVPVRVRVVGYTSHRHSVTATINGLPAGSLTFEGTAPATLEGTIAAEALRSTGNKLALSYTGETLPGSNAGDPLLYLDYLDLAISVATEPRAADFDLAPYDPTLPRFRGTDYLIVTHPLFRRQAERIARLKAAEGLDATVVETDAAYDRFSGGVVEPHAIQASIRAAAEASGRLRFVLLVGDDSFDPLDHAGRGAPSFVPSLFARDSGWGWVPSENLYADLDDDGAPDVAIGRLPVRTAAQADAVADKIAAQAAAMRALGETHLAVADNSTETDAPFRKDAESALLWLADGAPMRWADLAEGEVAARSALLSGWQDGVMATHYFGHGGLTEWADEQVLTSGDVAALGGGWKPTALFTWACLSQYYLGVDGPSLNESLVLQPGGGALASFGPAGITAPAHQAPLAANLYRELRAPGVTLGEAIQRAKAATLAERPAAREVIEGFHLFGDPALVLRRAAPVPR